MLDILRKHAQSWIIKVVLGAIIISFIFFFGYSSFRKGTSGGRIGSETGVAVKVNGTPVSLAEYEYFYTQNIDRVKSQFKGEELPDIAKKIADSSTMQQIIGREVALQQADELGLSIPDSELADTIKKLRTPPNGEFDPISYTHEFLPYFKGHFNIDFESFMRQNLRLSSLGEIFDKVDNVSPLTEGNSAAKDTLWTFETVELDPKALVESKSIKSADEAGAIAKTLIADGSSDWKKSLRTLKIDPVKAGPIKISDRKQLLGGTGSFDDYAKIFSLTKEHPVIGAPIELSGKFYVVKLVDRTEKPVDAASKPQSDDFFNLWMGKLLADAKVQNLMEKKK